MKELPILFSTPMVQAILEGRKTETRRKIKTVLHPDTKRIEYFSGRHEASIFVMRDEFERFLLTIIPRYHVGNILYVRETTTILEPEHCINGMKSRFVYKADMNPQSEEIRQDYIEAGWPYKWIPSIFMKKEAARIWLEVTDVKAERLQDINEEDAKAEGVNPQPDSKNKICCNCGRSFHQHILSSVGNPCFGNPTSFFNNNTFQKGFETIWNKINGKNSWQENPFVWVYKFKVLSKTGRPAILNQQKQTA